MSAWPGAVGHALRRRLMRRRLRACGARTSIDRWCTFIAPGNISFGSDVACGSGGFFAAEGGTIEVGSDVSFNTNVHVNASGGRSIKFGDHVLVGPNVVLRSANHRFERTDIPIRQQGHIAESIVIEDDVWLSANVVVVGGVRVGRGSIVAAGAVVTQDVPDMAVVGGIPARVLKMRTAAGSP